MLCLNEIFQLVYTKHLTNAKVLLGNGIIRLKSWSLPKIKQVTCHIERRTFIINEQINAG